MKNNPEPFDWSAFLRQERITHLEALRAERLSGSWVSCACGNLCDTIPRFGGGMPHDEELARLGENFHDHIVKIRVWCESGGVSEFKKDALTVLAQIEERSGEILKAMAHENNIH